MQSCSMKGTVLTMPNDTLAGGPDKEDRYSGRGQVREKASCGSHTEVLFTRKNGKTP